MTASSSTSRPAKEIPICRATVRLAFRDLGFMGSNGKDFSFSKLMSENFLGDKSENAYRDLYKTSKRPLSPKQQEKLLHYFRQRGYAARPDTFYKDHASPEAKFAYLKNGETEHTQYCESRSPTPEREIDYRIGLLGQGIIRIGAHFATEPAYQRDRIAWITELVQLINDHGLKPRQLGEIEAFLSRIFACTGCGKGTREIGAFRPLLDAVDEHRAEIEPALGSETEYRVLARLASQSAIHKSITGDIEGAQSAASFVFGAGMDGFLGAPNSQEVIQMLNPVKSIVEATDRAYGTYLERQAEAFGEYSDGRMALLQCKACAAIAGRLSEAEFDKAATSVENFRRGMERALRKSFGRSEAETDRIKERLFNADFLGLRFVEAKHRRSPDLPARIKRYAKDHGFTVAGVAMRQTTPIRHAQALYWLWLAENRRERKYLEKARDLIERNRHIKNLCSVEVNNLAELIETGLSISRA